MSYLDQIISPKPLVAAGVPLGFNDGANKGFWRVQPRSKVGRTKGQWIPMGAEVRLSIKDAKGFISDAYGRVVGSDGTTGVARVLVMGDNPRVPKGIYGLPTDNIDVTSAVIPKEFLKSKGIKNVKATDPDFMARAIDIADLSRADVTEDDIRMANDGINSPEGQEMEKFKDSEEGKKAAQEDSAAPADQTVKPASVDPVDDALSKLWNDAVYGDGANVDDAVKAIAVSPNGDKNYDVSIVEAKDIPIGSYLVDDKDNIVGQITSGGVVNGNHEFIITLPNQKKMKHVAKPTDKLGVATAKVSTTPAAPKAVTVKKNAKSAPAAPKMTNKQLDALDEFNDKVSKDQAIDPQLKQDYSDLMAKIDNGDEIDSAVAKDMIDRLKSHFSQAVTPKKAPAVRKPKAAPAKPAAPAAPGPISQRTPEEQAARDARKDGGEAIDPVDDGMDEAAQQAFVDEMRSTKITPLIDPKTGKRQRDPNNPNKIIEDTNAIIDKLLEKFPKAKIDDNDRVIIERQDWTDPVSGKTYQYELSVSRTVGNQFIQRVKFTDKASGDVQEFQLKDFKDSFTGLFGKTNGLLVLRDQLLGRTSPISPTASNWREGRLYFGPTADLNKRLQFFRGKGSSKLEDFRLFTFDEAADYFLEGGKRKLNKSESTKGGKNRSQFGNVMVPGRASAWEAIASGDGILAREIVLQHLGRVADNPEDLAKYAQYMRDKAKAKFATASTKEKQAVSAILTNIVKFANKQGRDIRDIDKVPFVSSDGINTVKVGDKVIYSNNENQTSVGIVTELTPASGANDYHDTATVKFATGSVNLLQTRNMVVPSTNPKRFGDPDVGAYTPEVQKEAKIKARADELGIDYDLWANRKQDATSAGLPFDINDPAYASPNVTQPYLGSQGTSGADVADDTATPDADQTPVDTTAPDQNASPRGNVNDLGFGDTLYGQDGEILGSIYEVQEIQPDDGGEPGLAIFYMDENGNEQVEIVDKSEDRGPK